MKSGKPEMPRTMRIGVYVSHYGVNEGATRVALDLAVIPGRETGPRAFNSHVGLFSDFYQKWIDADGSIARIVLLGTDHTGEQLYGVKTFKPKAVTYDLIQ